MKRLLLAISGLAIMLLLAACSMGGGADFTADLTTEAEVPPPNVGEATPSGEVTAELSEDETSLTVSGSYEGLTGPATAAHIHFGDVGVIGNVICPLTASNGTLSGTCSVAEDVADPATADAIDLGELQAGNYYVNVHTEANGSGEIRGQLE